MPKFLPPKSQLALHTRCENQIANEIDRDAVGYSDVLQVAYWTKQHPNELHRTSSPSRKYNCHGLSFASRRTAIFESQEIAKIIEDDEYKEVEYKDVKPGDIAVYYADGDAEHSGIVVSVDQLKVPSILSKWGFCHEVVHRLAICPYRADNVKFYRIIE